MNALKITEEKAMDKYKCPICGSGNIEYYELGCLCRIPGHSCWSHPV